MKNLFIITIIAILFFTNCQKKANKDTIIKKTIPEKLSYHEQYLNEIAKLPQQKTTDSTDMVFVASGTFLMGGNSNQARNNELPQHKETVSGFWIDKHEVTNSDFKKFIDATNYITTAEREIEFDGKKFPPGALVFDANNSNYWWKFVAGANWMHPYGPSSSIIGKENHPVVQVSWYDALAYAHWANKKLPTEVQYEYASRGKLKNNIYPWGNKFDDANLHANFFQGNFPKNNSLEDLYEKTAPVASLLPNSIGLFDISGNVWEWCLDTYHEDAYYKLNSRAKGAFIDYYNSQQQKVMRGGSYLCSESYCTGYRSAARMSSSPDTGLEHTGFRCVIAP